MLDWIITPQRPGDTTTTSGNSNSGNQQPRGAGGTHQSFRSFQNDKRRHATPIRNRPVTAQEVAAYKAAEAEARREAATPRYEHLHSQAELAFRKGYHTYVPGSGTGRTSGLMPTVALATGDPMPREPKDGEVHGSYRAFTSAKRHHNTSLHVKSSYGGGSLAGTPRQQQSGDQRFATPPPSRTSFAQFEWEKRNHIAIVDPTPNYLRGRPSSIDIGDGNGGAAATRSATPGRYTSHRELQARKMHHETTLGSKRFDGHQTLEYSMSPLGF
eukprot:PhM_4_TR12855/c0_g1_i1/m.79777